MNGAHPSLKTDTDHLMKDNQGCYCLKTFKTAKGKKESGERRESNPGPLPQTTSALPLNYGTHRPGFNSSQHQFSFLSFAVSKVFGQQRPRLSFTR